MSKMKWYVGIVLAVITAAGTPVMAQTNNELQLELLTRIDNSRKALERLEKSVSEERISLGQQLQTRETNITELREQAETVQRRRDEKLLGLDQLENRLEQWQRQNNYQQHILRSYADEFSEVSVGPDDNGDDLKLVVNLLEGSLDRLETFMRPD